MVSNITSVPNLWPQRSPASAVGSPSESLRQLDHTGQAGNPDAVRSQNEAAADTFSRRTGTGEDSLRSGYLVDARDVERDQLVKDVLEKAQQAGFTNPKDLEELKTKLLQGRFSVSNQQPGRTLNLNQKSLVADKQALNRLLKAAKAELSESSAGDVNQQVKVGTLIDTGEVPDGDNQGRFITYRSQKMVNPDNTEVYRLFQEKYTLGKNSQSGQLQASKQVQEVQASAIDSLSQQFEVMEPEKFGYQGLSTDAAHLKRLQSLFQSGLMKGQFTQLAKQLPQIKASINHPDSAPALAKAVAPIQQQIASAYGLPNLPVQVQAQSPDNGLTIALYDHTKKAVVLYAPGLNTLYKGGEALGLSGETLDRYVAMRLGAVLAHETRHAYQYEAVKNPTAFGLNPNTPQDAASIKALKLNMRYYVAPTFALMFDGSPRDYEEQSMEAGVHPFQEAAEQTLSKVLNVPVSKTTEG